MKHADVVKAMESGEVLAYTQESLDKQYREPMKVTVVETKVERRVVDNNYSYRRGHTKNDGIRVRTEGGHEIVVIGRHLHPLDEAMSAWNKDREFEAHVDAQKEQCERLAEKLGGRAEPRYDRATFKYTSWYVKLSPEQAEALVQRMDRDDELLGA